MARVKIEAIIEHLDSEMKRALEESVKSLGQLDVNAQHGSMFPTIMFPTVKAPP